MFKATPLNLNVHNNVSYFKLPEHQEVKPILTRKKKLPWTVKSRKKCKIKFIENVSFEFLRQNSLTFIHFRIDRKAIFGIFAKKNRGQNNFSVTSFVLEQCDIAIFSCLWMYIWIWGDDDDVGFTLGFWETCCNCLFVFPSQLNRYDLTSL